MIVLYENLSQFLHDVYPFVCCYFFFFLNFFFTLIMFYDIVIVTVELSAYANNYALQSAVAVLNDYGRYVISSLEIFHY